MRFAILGTVRAIDEGTPVALPPKDRIVLATLLLRAGQVVSVAALATAIWDDTPPPSARNTIQGQIKRLRQALGTLADRIVTKAPGYLIEVRPGELDLDLFTALRERAALAARAGEWDRSGELLKEAIGLWHGEPLSDVPSAYLRRTEVPRLTELRDEAIEARIDTDLNLGRHGIVTAELRGLVAEHPFRERLWEQLMLALYRDGRQSDALGAYQEARNVLSAELGIDPGPRLQELHQQILTNRVADLAGRRPSQSQNQGQNQVRSQGQSRSQVRSQSPPAGGRPRQLPADLPDFTGRDDDADRLYDLLSQPGDRPGAVTIAAVTGPGGIGKTALAVHVAHRAAERFPDGQLFVHLGGATSPAPATDVLARLLRDLGIPDTAIPEEADERAARYRTAMADRKMLIVLDDAHGSAQVRPLLPGTGGSAVIITSRAPLADLAGTAFAGLTVLSPDESKDLFTAIVGNRRAADDPDATDGIVTSCAGLPLAIRIAASRLATRPGWTAGQLSELLASERQRLSELAAGDTAVRATFEVSYLALPAEPARVFRLFGLAGLPTLTVPALAALAGQPVEHTAEAVAALVDAHLLESPDPGRFQAHDLLRIYAAERADTDETDGSRREAVSHLLTWYLHALNNSVAALRVDRAIKLEPPPPSIPAHQVSGLQDAVDWLDAERTNLVRMVSVAASAGEDETCWRLATLLRYYFEWTGHWADQITVGTVGLPAAERSGNSQAAGMLLNVLGAAYWKLGRLDVAAEHYDRVLRIRRELGDRKGEATILSNLGLVEVDSGSITSAIGRFTQALAVNRELDYPYGVGYCLHNLASAYEKSGRLDEALTHYEQALEIRTKHSCPLSDQASTTHSIGALLITMGRPSEAMDYLQRALKICQDSNLSYGEGMTLASLGDCYQATGKRADALAAWQRAYDILSDLGVPEASEVRDRW